MHSEKLMPDRVHHNPDLIYSVGTQVVTLVEITLPSSVIMHPAGTVGVVIKAPTDLEHSYRVRLPDGSEVALRRTEVTMLALFKEGEITRAAQTAADPELMNRVIYRCVVGSQAWQSRVIAQGYSPSGDDAWATSKLYPMPVDPTIYLVDADGLPRSCTKGYSEGPTGLERALAKAEKLRDPNGVDPGKAPDLSKPEPPTPAPIRTPGPSPGPAAPKLTMGNLLLVALIGFGVYWVYQQKKQSALPVARN